MKMKVQLDKNAFTPTRAYSSDAGLDILSPVSAVVPQSTEYFGDVTVGCVVIDTGVHVAIPEGYVGLLKSKSGLNVKNGITSEGVIDAGYTGSMKVKLYNHTPVKYHIKRGDKITQLIILPIISPEIEIVEELAETDRGDRGFGSSGK